MKRSRVEFTKPMKKTHTILIPSMLDFHFPLLKYAFLSGGYKCDVIGVNEYSRSQMINAGWEYSNNDVCFPCNIIIGQFICKNSPAAASNRRRVQSVQLHYAAAKSPFESRSAKCSCGVT